MIVWLLMEITLMNKANFEKKKIAFSLLGPGLFSPCVKNLKIDVSNWSPLVAHIVMKKLDRETFRSFEQTIKEPREIQNLNDLLTFIETRFLSLETTGEVKKRVEQRFDQNNRKNWPVRAHHASTGACRYCKGQHTIYSCQKFQQLKPSGRLSFMTQNKICKNSLNHEASEKCHSTKRCQICNQFHHSLLHIDQKETAKIAINSHVTTKTKRDCNVLLATALVKARTTQQSFEYLRALIDPGSQATLITEYGAQRLGVPREKIHAEITGMGGVHSGVACSKIQVELIPRFPANNFTLHCEALVLPTLTKAQAEHGIIPEKLQHNNFLLADPTFDTPGPIDIILGADAFTEIILDGIKKTENGVLCQRTHFGWILSGRTIIAENISTKIVSMLRTAEINTQLKKLWEVEEVPPEDSKKRHENKCEEIFRKTTKRGTDRKFTVHVPFKEDITERLREAQSRALARLFQMERRFAKDKNLHREYKKFMDEYLRLGHMVPVEENKTETKPNIYYMPHQAVIKEDSTTTKLRVVFDASTKTSSGVSLNDMMYNGPKLQSELQSILLRWRKHQWAFTAVIEKMYRQIRVTENHQDYQRVLWRSTPDERIREFKVTTVTYGTTSAPYLAVKTLQSLAKEEARTYPEAARVVQEDFYVDDLMSGTHSLQKAKVLQRNLVELLSSGGFNLRKWRTNNAALAQNLPEDLRDKTYMEISDNETVKTLGVYWNPTKDEFRFKVHLNVDEKEFSKRTVLADIAKLFDPLGWITPVMIKAKLLLQELWIKEYTWDQQLSEDIAIKWGKFRRDLTSIENISIPRWNRYAPSISTIELHGFADASEKVYGAVVYSRVTTEYGKKFVTLLTSKTKVAPLRKISVPRLELCGAVLVAKILDFAKRTLQYDNAATYAWTDSIITLSWKKSNPERWDTFVSNREKFRR